MPAHSLPSLIPLLAVSAVGLMVCVGGLVFAARKVAALPKAPSAPKRKFEVEYERREPMTQTERKFFLRLAAAVPQAVVAPQVAMSALVDAVAAQREGKFKHVNRSKVAQQRVDYVMFDAGTGEPVCVVELDDHTHDAPKKKAADRERDRILEEAGYTVVRFDARQMPSVTALREYFTQ